jgi:hypothetical protein
VASRRTKDFIWLTALPFVVRVHGLAPILTMKGKAQKNRRSIVAEQCFVNNAAKRAANQWRNPEQPELLQSPTISKQSNAG